MFVLVHVNFMAILTQLGLNCIEFFTYIMWHHDLCNCTGDVWYIGLCRQILIKFCASDTTLAHISLALLYLGLLFRQQCKHIVESLAHYTLNVYPLGRRSLYISLQLHKKLFRALSALKHANIGLARHWSLTSEAYRLVLWYIIVVIKEVVCRIIADSILMSRFKLW